MCNVTYKSLSRFGIKIISRMVSWQGGTMYELPPLVCTEFGELNKKKVIYESSP